MLFLRILFPFFLFGWMLVKIAEKPAPSMASLKNGATGLKNFSTSFYPEKHLGDCIVEHSAFTLCYAEEYEQARWVAYRLTADMVTGKGEERTDNFRADKAVETGSATPDDYKKSGYDRGHLCPAGDMGWDATAMSESFLMSNMSPQAPQFNRGIWKKLEEKVRGWATENSELYIVTAGVLEGQLPVIGIKNKVGIPRYYYKVILDIQEPQIKAIAFVLPNEGSSSPLLRYAVSIDSVEKLTHINFFPVLPDVMEDSLEARFDPGLW